MPTGSHFEFAFLHKPIVYGVARLLYGVATSDSVYMYTPFQSGINLSFIQQHKVFLYETQDMG